MTIKKLILSVLATILCVGFAGNSLAEKLRVTEEFSPLLGVEATKEDVVDLVEKAEEYFKTHTLEESDAMFSTPEYLQQDLYLFVLEKSGVAIIHGLEPNIKGVNLIATRDAEGVPFVESFLEVEDREWVSYLWRHPLLGRIMQKNTYIVRLPGDRFMGAGYYEE